MATYDVNVTSMQASAEFLGTGAVEINAYQTEIEDIVRRGSLVLPRLKQVRATGAFHRFFEQVGIATAVAQDPRNLSATPSGPTRMERPAAVKALTSQSNFSLYDLEVTKQQGQFASVEATDVQDIVSAIQVKRGKMLWAGTDTSLAMPTTFEYVGLLTQITLQATIAPGASIIDGLKAEVAAMVSNQNYDVRPTAIILNPILANYIDTEAKAAKIELKESIIAGVTVQALATTAGILPLISDPYMPIAAGAAYGFGAPPAGSQNYFAAIVTEERIELPTLSIEGDPNPRVMQLGLVNDLNRKLVGVHFGCVIAIGPSYSHSIVCVQRP